MVKISGRRAGRVNRKRKARVSYKNVKRQKVVATRNMPRITVGKGFPKKLCMTHKYHENTAVSTAALGALGYYVYSCNSLFDPNVTGTGHQPMYFDQLCGIYDHYTVIGSKMVVKMCSSGTSNSPFRVGIYVNDDATVTPTTANALLEHSSNISWKQIPPGCNNMFTLTCKWGAKKTFGGSILGNDNLQGSVTTSPSEQSMFVLFIESNDGGTVNTLVADISIEYITVWDELKDIVSS